MPADRSEPTSPADAPGAAAASAAAAPGAGGGIKAWLPLLLNLLLMPVVAYFTTTLLLVPKLNSSGASHASEDGHSGHGETGSGSAKAKHTVPLTGKVLVNIAGTAGTRYLLVNLSLVGPHANLKERIEKNEAELRDVAAGVLATKTIADLEKPGARNLIRAELIGVFNNVLGDGAVTELFLTEFAIQ